MTNEPVYLRPLDDGDLPRTLAWHNDPALYETLGGTFRYVSRAVEVEWLRKAQAFSTTDVNLAICLVDGGEHIGNVYLRGIDWIARHGELHVLIGDVQHRGRGHGRSALRQIVRHATRDLGLRRLYLYVLEDNQPAVRVYENCGFTVEGRLRRHAFKGGRFRDLLVMGRCFDDEPPTES